MLIDGEYTIGKAVDKGEAVSIDLWYPRQPENKVKYIEIGLIDVRATDGIRISFDFDRNGWMIEQPTKSTWDADDTICDQCWVEVAFCGAFAKSEG
jgi:hypothetical protein